MKTLFVSDLDGTLLNSNQEISPYTAEVITELVKRGECFCYATARSLITTRKATKGLDCPFPVICHNGVFIRDNTDGRYIAKHTFEKEKILKLIDKLIEREMYPIVYSIINGEEKFSYIWDKLTDSQKFFAGSRGEDDPRIRKVDTIEELCEGEIFYLACIDEKDKLSPLVGLCEGDWISIFQPDTYDDFYWLEIMPKEATKAKAAKELAGILGCERIVAFGDGRNDAALFNISDEAYAVANAHDDLKALADAVIASNDEDGVAKWLYENILTK